MPMKLVLCLNKFLSAGAVVCLLLFSGCGASEQSQSVDLSIAVDDSHDDGRRTGIDARRPASAGQMSNAAVATPASPQKTEAGLLPNAGRYSEYYRQRPISAVIMPFEPQPTFYALLYNCGGCHEFVKTLSSVQERLAKNRKYGSLQQRITMGQMPPNKPNFARSDEGQELIRMLNTL